MTQDTERGPMTETVGLRGRIAEALFDAFRDGFEEAYGERPEGWAETSEATRVLWRDHADALLPTEGEPDPWAHIGHGGFLRRMADKWDDETEADALRCLADGVEFRDREWQLMRERLGIPATWRVDEWIEEHPTEGEPVGMTFATHWDLLLDDPDGLTVRRYDPDETRKVTPVWIGTPPVATPQKGVEVERLRETVQPFVDAAEAFEDSYHTDDLKIVVRNVYGRGEDYSVTVGDFRRLRAALNPETYG